MNTWINDKWNKFFRPSQKNTASLAKERLKIILTHDRIQGHGKKDNDFLPLLQKDILKVISKYIKVDADQVKVQLDRIDGSSKLELNVTLPETVQ